MKPNIPFLLISDLDDTIKITHTTSRLRTVIRGLWGAQAYAGMPELYQEWIGDREFFVVSSSPVWIEAKIQRFLNKFKFPPSKLFLRDWVRETKVADFKFQRLNKLVLSAKERGIQVILVGDDSEYDPEVFDRLKSEHPDTVLKAYVRSIRGRKIPDGLFPFYLAFDIAVEEYREKRLLLPQLMRVGKATLDQTNPEYVIPYFAHHPEKLSQEVISEISMLQTKIDLELRKIYYLRKMDPTVW